MSVLVILAAQGHIKTSCLVQKPPYLPPRPAEPIMVSPDLHWRPLVDA